MVEIIIEVDPSGQGIRSCMSRLLITKSCDGTESGREKTVGITKNEMRRQGEEGCERCRSEVADYFYATIRKCYHFFFQACYY